MARKSEGITQADLNALPAQVARYVALSGALEKPRIHGFQTDYEGRFRNGFDALWKGFHSTQVNVVAPSSRHFLMEDSMYGLPLTGLHRFVGEVARLQTWVPRLNPPPAGEKRSFIMLQTGSLAPDLTLPDQDGSSVSLSDRKGKWTVLYFYPKDNTPGCTLEAMKLTATLTQFHKAGAEVRRRPGLGEDALRLRRAAQPDGPPVERPEAGRASGVRGLGHQEDGRQGARGRDPVDVPDRPGSGPRSRPSAMRRKSCRSWSN